MVVQVKTKLMSTCTAQAMALARVKLEVLVVIVLNFSHSGLVTYLATKECLDLMSGKSPILAGGGWGDVG